MTVSLQMDGHAVPRSSGNAIDAAAPRVVNRRGQRGLWTLWLAFVFLLPLIPRTGGNGILGSGWLANYLYTDFILFGMAAAIFLRRGKLAGLNQRYVRTACAFLVALTAMQYLALLFGVLKGSTFEMSYLGTGVEWCRLIATFVVASWAATVTGGLKKTYRIFLLGFVIVCAIGLLEAANVGIVVALLNRSYGTQTHVGAAILAMNRGYAKLTSTLDRNPHGFAQYLGIGMALFTSTFYFTKRLSRTARFFLIGLFCVSALLVIETREMTSILSALVVLAVVFFYSSRRPGKRIHVAIMAVVIGIALIAGAESIHVLARLSSLTGELAGGGAQSVGEGSFSVRYEVAEVVWDQVTHDPLIALFGTDPARLVEFTRSEYSIDSQYFYILFTLGFPGLFVFVALLLFCFTRIHRKIKICRDQTGSVATLLVTANAVLGALMVTNFSGAFSVGSTFARTSNIAWSIVGLALAIDPRGNAA